jgi:protein SCO1/2
MRRTITQTGRGGAIAGCASATIFAALGLGPAGRAAEPGDDPKAPPTAPCCADCAACKAKPEGQPGAGRYARTVASYKIPDVKLLDAEGRQTSLAVALDHDGPVLLQFVFTTCTTICPAMTGSFSAFQGKLGDQVKKVRMVSISIDPEHDRPDRLRAHAKSLEAGPQWRFYTGRVQDIAAVQKAFDAYVANKMWHQPLTLMRPRRDAPWIRCTGLLSAAELTAEYRRMVQE